MRKLRLAAAVLLLVGAAAAPGSAWGQTLDLEGSGDAATAGVSVADASVTATSGDTSAEPSTGSGAGSAADASAGTDAASGEVTVGCVDASVSGDASASLGLCGTGTISERPTRTQRTATPRERPASAA